LSLGSFNPLSTGHARTISSSPERFIRGFNPLSTGHARISRRYSGSIPEVSIPYLRVTHQLRKTKAEDVGWFQSPIYGSRTNPNTRIPTEVILFQSPIYGSRTLWHRQWGKARFVSIPYLRVTHLIELYRLLGREQVSIPYLRVTHKEIMEKAAGENRVSIPYLRVTHIQKGLIDYKPSGFQSPIYGSRTRQSAKLFGADGDVSIPYLRVTHELAASVLSPTCRFQSPIYGSRTRSTCRPRSTRKGFNPLSTGHAR